MMTLKMIGMRSLGIGLAFLLLPGIALAGEPTDQIKATVDKVLEILKDPALKGPEKTKERRAKIRGVVKERFDFAETAKRSLGIHWAQRTPKEREEFVKLFWDLLELSYVDKIETYSDEKILYVGESIDGDFATVRSKIEDRKHLAFPLEYRLYKRDGKWWVYDVVIEGVSLINNYRTQFNKIIRTASYEELIRRMRAKLEGEEVSGLSMPEGRSR